MTAEEKIEALRVWATAPTFGDGEYFDGYEGAKQSVRNFIGWKD